MELATFKRSVLTQIDVIKQYLCVCTYVCLLDFWFLFICFSFVCETISPSVGHVFVLTPNSLWTKTFPNSLNCNARQWKKQMGYTG